MNTPAIVAVAKAARVIGPDFPGYLSPSEACTAALALNRADWLKKLGFTMAEAINRVDRDTVGNLFAAQQQLQCEPPLVEA